MTSAPGMGSFTYDAENRMTAGGGVNYTYDGDGKRVAKSNGKLYWYGMSGLDALLETDSAGNTPTEYVFFGGKRIARRDPSGAVFHYFSNHLGSTSVITNASGTIVEESDYYPFGGERVVVNNDPNPYKFTGKERDSESGLDNFGARYMTSSLGRFMSPDPLLNSGRPWNSQTWNRYTYTRNNPLNFIDPTGLYEWAANTCAQDDKKCNKQYEKNQQNARDALKNLEKARDKFKPGTKEYNRLDAALKAFGKEGEKNGVTVGFGALAGKAAATTIPQDNNSRWDVMFDTSKLESSGEWAAAAGHEGTHVDDFSNLNRDPSLGNVLTPFSIEYRGYETSVFVTRGLGFDMLKFGNNVLWNSSWRTVDEQTRNMDRGITKQVIDVYGHPETKPHNPLPN